MAYATSNYSYRDTVLPQTATQPKRSFFKRVIDAIVASQQRRAEIEIARFLRSRGGKMSDEVEREIERRFLLPPNQNL